MPQVFPVLTVAFRPINCNPNVLNTHPEVVFTDMFKISLWLTPRSIILQVVVETSYIILYTCSAALLSCPEGDDEPRKGVEFSDA